MSDLLDEQGNIYDFEIFKTRFGLRGTFLDFQSLIRKIPNRWKTTLNNNKNICIINNFNVKCIVYVKLVLKDKKGCRWFYDLMKQSKKIELTNKWMQELGFINEEEHTSLNKVIRSIKEIRLKDFQYKVKNKILVTKSFLHKINKVDNNICAYCNLQRYIIFLLNVK